MSRLLMALIVGIAVLSSPTVHAGDSAPFKVEPIWVINSPVGVTYAPGDFTRRFVYSAFGIIRVEKEGTLLTQPFLHIVDDVQFAASNAFYSMAFHPDYQNNGVFFISYTSTTHVIIERLTTLNPDLADPDSRDVIHRLSHSTLQHNGGQIKFGPDGYLYISIGDGGPATPAPGRAQSILDRWGCFMRVDVDGDDFPEDDNRDYAIPPDNPFVGVPLAQEEIWAYGIRMPWQWDFHPKTGDIFFGDVGRTDMEEISRIPAGVGGLNFGWPCFEGTMCTGFGFCDCDDKELVPPVHTYTRDIGKCVVGGKFYYGCAIPELYGKYVFADYVDGKIFVATLSEDQTKFNTVEDVTALVTQDVGDLQFITSVGIDAYGELYLTERVTDMVYKLVRTDGPVSDCNEDGIDDACQFLDGTFQDADGNGVPDSCETVLCAGDCDGNGQVNFADLVAMLSMFGDTDAGTCNANQSGRIDFADLVAALAIFGDCPN